MSLFSKNIVGINLHDYSLELIELKSSGKKMSLEGYKRIAIEPKVLKNGELVDTETLKKIIQTGLSSAQPKAIQNKEIAVIFPSSKVFTHIFQFPANLTKDELKKAIPYEAEKVIPFEIDKVYWDFTVVSKDDASKTHASQSLFFAAIEKEAADEYANLIQSMGLIPMLFAVHSDALRYGLQADIPKDQTVLIIDFSTSSTNYLIVENTKTKHFFSKAEGGRALVEDMAKVGQVSETMVLQAKDKNEFAQDQLAVMSEFVRKNAQIAKDIIKIHDKENPDNKVISILLTGSFLCQPHFESFLKQQIPEYKVVVGDPTKGLTLPSGAIPETTCLTNAIEVAAEGLIAKSDDSINLVPDQLKGNLLNKKKNLAVAIFSILMAAISTLASVFIVFKHQDLGYDRDALAAQKSAVEKLLYGTRYQEIRAAIEQFNGEVSAIKSIDDSLFSTPMMIEKVVELLPAGVKLTGIKFDDEFLSVEVSGVADTRETLLETQENFEQAEFVQEVILPISNYDEKYELSFILEIKLEFSELLKYASSTST